MHHQVSMQKREGSNLSAANTFALTTCLSVSREPSRWCRRSAARSPSGLLGELHRVLGSSKHSQGEPEPRRSPRGAAVVSPPPHATALACQRLRVPLLSPFRCLAAFFCVPLAAAAEGQFALATWRAAAPTAAAGWRLTSQIVLTGLYFYGYSEVANPNLNPNPHSHPDPHPHPHSYPNPNP